MATIKSLTLSNTAITTYDECPQKYKLHYLDKLRPDYIASPLVFGNALDKAFNILLLQKKKKLTEEESKMLELDPFKVFVDTFSKSEICGNVEFIIRNKKFSCYRSDLDIELLEEEDLLELKSYIKEDVVEHLLYCIEHLKIQKFLEPAHQLNFNMACWFSLKRKGFLMIEAYKTDVMPHIQEVFDIQKKVELPSSTDDILIGYIDFIASFKEDGVIRVVDNKTSSVRYKEDSVSTSQQLAIYSEFMETDKAAYVVLSKKLRKKDPRVNVDIILGEISEQFFNKVFDNVGNVCYNIKNEIFPKKEDSCFSYGKKCPYHGLCRGDSSLSGLKKLEEK